MNNNNEETLKRFKEALKERSLERDSHGYVLNFEGVMDVLLDMDGNDVFIEIEEFISEKISAFLTEKKCVKETDIGVGLPCCASSGGSTLLPADEEETEAD